MKKALSLLLALVLCLSLCACNSDKGDVGAETNPSEAANTELNLIQEWKSISDGITLEFDAEGYCHLNGSSYPYEYDKEADQIIISAGYQFSCPVSLVDGVYRIEVDGVEIVPASEYERLHKEYAQTMLVISGFDGTPALNSSLVGEHINRVELTVENWREYIKVYQYDAEVVEKDAFGEIISKETQTATRLGFGPEQYSCLCAIIELQHKETGEFLTFNTSEDVWLYEYIDLDEYECTRIQGYMYFFDFTEDVMSEVLNRYDRSYASSENAEIQVTSSVFEATWSVDCDGKYIENRSGQWEDYFD